MGILGKFDPVAINDRMPSGNKNPVDPGRIADRNGDRMKPRQAGIVCVQVTVFDLDNEFFHCFPFPSSASITSASSVWVYLSNVSVIVECRANFWTIFGFMPG